jgi:type III secretion system YscD/HrpQ family protein
MSEQDASPNSADIIRRTYQRSPRLASPTSIAVVEESQMTQGGPTDDDGAAGESRLLRLLYGAHFGVELTLLTGRYLLGTDDDCDIVLSDSRLAPRHAFLILGPEQMSVDPVEGAVTVAGTDIAGVTELAPFQPVLMGNTVFALGPPDAPWPAIDPPKPDAEDEDLAMPNPNEGPAGVMARPPQVAPASRGGSRRGRMTVNGIATAAVVLLVAIVAYRVLEGTPHAPVAEDAATLTLQARVQAVLDTQTFPHDLTLVPSDRSAGSHPTVRGYVATEEQRRQLLAALQPVRSEVELHVWSTALLKESLQQTLAGMQLDVAVASVDDGRVVLTGLLPESMSASRLEQALRRDVPGIASIDFEATSVADAER